MQLKRKAKLPTVIGFLLKKLDHYGIRGKTLDLIRAFLTDKTPKVTVEGVVSESIHVKSGTMFPREELGHIVFLISINNLPSSVKYHSRLFADDCGIQRDTTKKTARLSNMTSRNYGNGRSCGECHSTL